MAAVDYSLGITWAYFSVYVAMFLVVSIVCAVTVKKAKDPNASCFSLIKAWGMQMWVKKKVSFSLILNTLTPYALQSDLW